MYVEGFGVVQHPASVPASGSKKGSSRFSDEELKAQNVSDISVRYQWSYYESKKWRPDFLIREISLGAIFQILKKEA